ncbi:hypothetical protein [Cupriavidus plantarum]|uniref:hypothetical protein n=1 Tax=Cupriavidus plantarum TaxID=942865 RepID=UPI000EB2260C|nr:hypothetical protein [Cupriavidus plantarum]RLK45951.1 putative phiE125 gp8 family phage protein [Cupriavidus plantarum]
MRAVITPPVEEAISLERAKRHLLIDDEADEDIDQDIRDGIVAAREDLEGRLRRPLLPQVCEVRAIALERRLRLWNDVIEVMSIMYADADGNDQVLPIEQCRLELGVWLRLAGDLPRDATSVRVRFRCGAFAQPADVPRSLVQWMLLHLGTGDRIRQLVTRTETFDVPTSYTDRLIHRYEAAEI